LRLDPAEELRLGDGRVVMRVHVAPGDQHPFETGRAGLHDAVRKQTPTLRIQNHVIRLHTRHVHRTDVENVGRPYRREHARAGDADARLAVSIQDLRQQSRRDIFEIR
jgi:hypothetical protein